jgi:hypothetical protein
VQGETDKEDNDENVVECVALFSDVSEDADLDLLGVEERAQDANTRVAEHGDPVAPVVDSHGCLKGFVLHA